MTRIVVIDNHGQFTHLEHRALRDLGVDTDLIDNDVDPDDVEADGIVLSGGPDMDRAGRSAEYLDRDVPVLGICLGMQLIAEKLGGGLTVERGCVDEFDKRTLTLDCLIRNKRLSPVHSVDIVELGHGTVPPSDLSRSIGGSVESVLW